jgi:hypothetical protein
LEEETMGKARVALLPLLVALAAGVAAFCWIVP